MLVVSYIRIIFGLTCLLQISKTVFGEEFNECVDGTHDCGTQYVCTNTLGSYNCTCKYGDEDPCPDCGKPQVPVNGSYVGRYYLQEDVVTYSCDTGFALIGTKTTACQVDGTFDNLAPTCFVDCRYYDSPTNGGVYTYSSTTSFAIATYTCNTEDKQIGGKTRTCLLTGQLDGMNPSCVNPGKVTRTCDFAGHWKLPRYNCVREHVQDIQGKVSTLSNTSSTEDLNHSIDELKNVSSHETSDVEDKLTDGELIAITKSLETVATFVATTNVTDNVTDGLSDDFLDTVSNLIDVTNRDTWKTLHDSDDGGANLIAAVDTLAESLAKQLIASMDSNKTITTTNIVLEIKKTTNEDVMFPLTSAYLFDAQPWINESLSRIVLPAQAFPDQQDIQWVTTCIMYRNMSEVLPTNQATNVTDDKEINGPVMSLTITPLLGKLELPVQITFQHLNKGYGKPICCFWTFTSAKQGYWSTDGCTVVSSNTTLTTCACDHLTNFAVLMSPFKEGSADSAGLRIVSIVGISVSIVGLLLTLVVQLCLWRYVRSDRAVILMHLCGALLASYIVFLAGADRTESKAFCTAVAVMLHYIYLVVFALMLAEGVEISVAVLYVFATKSRKKILLILAWLIPAIIVGVSLGVTQGDGYGNDNFCWLSVNSGLIWAFVGPALAIIGFNLVCLIVVLRIMFTTKVMTQKARNDKIKTSVRSLCVLVPLMGISWIFGIFYINDDFYWTQYVFAVCNGLQGFFIFLFHCLLNTQIKKAFTKKNRKRTSKAIFASSTKSTTVTDSKEFKQTTRPRDTSETCIEYDSLARSREDQTNLVLPTK